MRKVFLVLSIVIIGFGLLFFSGEANQGEAQERNLEKEKHCAGIGIVTNYIDNSLHLLGPETNTLYGPYLSGELGEGYSLLNAAVTPDGKTAVISNYNSYSIFFVELPHRFDHPPTLLDSINIGYNAEDIAITPDGKYALISYGGSESFIAVVDIEIRSLITTYELTFPNKVSGIEVAPDGQTVLAIDKTNRQIHVLILDEDGNLNKIHSIALNFKPSNIAISPDGLTAIVVNPTDGLPAVLRIKSPGDVVLVKENIPLQCPFGVSAVFSVYGSKVYYLSSNGSGNYLHLLEMMGSGIVKSSESCVTLSPKCESGVNLGIYDTIAIEPGGRYAYAGRKISNTDYKDSIAIIDLKTKEQKYLNGGDFPASITFGCLASPPAKPTSDQPPFGSYDSPEDGSTVRSSVAVTGWALDDVEVESVKIYRQQGSTLVYIGDAVFVEGARPDVAQVYPDYPNNTRAGWGYMMLSNFLPNGGNGTFKIHAIAKDTYGHEVSLGIKTIHCDNAHATKPFGAIDTPEQGETISGTNCKIQGWVLTPPPNKIPEDGSTINVFIDEQSVGHAAYNIYRSDIATLFPGYANSDGALAYFDFDPTQYSNGIHTLEWIVTDNAGNSDGIGSRFFYIQNDDGEPFSVGITSPENGGSITVTTSTIDISGVVSGNPTLTWTLNGTQKGAIYHSNGVWNINNIPLTEGKNTIVVIATSGGQQKEDTLLVYRNSTIEFSGPLTLSEDMVEIGTDTDVDFFIGVAEDTSGLTKMELISVDSTGEIIGVLSEMKDDGVSPDDIPNDNIYTCRLSVKENSDISRFYQARATLSGNTGWSTVVTITFYKPLTDAEITEEIDFSDEAKEHADSPDELADWLNQQPGISNVEKTAFHVSWTSKNNIRYGIIYRDEELNKMSQLHKKSDNYPEIPGSEEKIQESNTFYEVMSEDRSSIKAKNSGGRNSPGIEKGGPGQSKYRHYYKLVQSRKTFDSSEINQVGSNKVLIWLPYAWHGLYFNIFQNQDNRFDVSVKPDCIASVESVKNWAQYGTIFINTHGLGFAIATYTELNMNSFKKYHKDIIKCRIVLWCTGYEGDKWRLWITPSFIEKYCGSFPNSFIYIGACQSFEGDFKSTFIKKGAGGVIGFTHSVYAPYDKKIAGTVAEELIDEKTVSEALAEAKKQHGNFDKSFKGKKAFASCIPANSDLVIITSGLTNGDFETGDLRGWSPQGDVRVLQSIGPITHPQGNYMAILSTGFGAVDDSTSILEQTFNVPNDAKKLTFKYNWVSEEPREWINWGYNDQMEISLIPKSGSSITIVAKDIDNTTWIPSGDTGYGDLFSGGDETAFETGWKSISFDISAYKGKQVTLRAKVWDIGDSIYDSACFLDQITIE
jgi:hypothetical protein